MDELFTSRSIHLETRVDFHFKPFPFKLSTKPFHMQTSISLYVFPVHNFHLWVLREYVNMDNADSKGLINLGGRVKVGLVESWVFM